MKEYILNIKFESWQNQLWFMNKDTEEVRKKWQESFEVLEKMKKECKEPMEYQDRVTDYLKKLGFLRIQK